jgi:hypothetical protein
MPIILKPDSVKSMTKEARSIIEGTYKLVNKHQPDVEYDVYAVECAARVCTVAKYLNIAKTWVKVPKKKSYEEWVAGLANFANFFEKSGVAAKGLSQIYQNRNDGAIVWNDKMVEIYHLCSKSIPYDWSSYEEMDHIISWLGFSMGTIRKAFEETDVYDIRYINAILTRNEAKAKASQKNEEAHIVQGGTIPQTKESFRPVDLSFSEVRDRIEYMKFQEAFKDEED